MIAGVTVILTENIERIGALFNGRGDIQREGKIASFVIAYQMSVHINLASLIYGAEMKQQMAGRGIFTCCVGDLKGSLIAQSLPGHQLAFYTGQRRFGREGYQDLALPGGQSIGRGRDPIHDGIVPQSV